jgi:hypothetical protein
MNTVYDWITVLIFAALVTRFLQQSAKPADDQESLWHYLVASIGCAGANWLGNNGWHLAAAACVAATIAYAFHFLRARGPRPRR